MFHSEERSSKKAFLDLGSLFYAILSISGDKNAVLLKKQCYDKKVAVV
jgi:hypothetical protein